MPPAEATESTHPRKKIRCIKLCKILNTILPILATQRPQGITSEKSSILDMLSTAVGILKELYKLLPSHTVTVEGSCAKP